MNSRYLEAIAHATGGSIVTAAKAKPVKHGRTPKIKIHTSTIDIPLTNDKKINQKVANIVSLLTANGFAQDKRVKTYFEFRPSDDVLAELVLNVATGRADLNIWSESLRVRQQVVLPLVKITEKNIKDLAEYAKQLAKIKMPTVPKFLQ